MASLQKSFTIYAPASAIALLLTGCSGLNIKPVEKHTRDIVEPNCSVTTIVTKGGKLLSKSNSFKKAATKTCQRNTTVENAKEHRAITAHIDIKTDAEIAIILAIKGYKNATPAVREKIRKQVVIGLNSKYPEIRKSSEQGAKKLNLSKADIARLKVEVEVNELISSYKDNKQNKNDDDKSTAIGTRLETIRRSDKESKKIVNTALGKEKLSINGILGDKEICGVIEAYGKKNVFTYKCSTPTP